MPTFSESAAARDAQWAVVITIEGCGNYTGMWRFCSTLPTYASAQYRAWLMEWPEIASEKVDILGGVPDAGELEIQLLDFDDTLTSEWRIEADPRTALNGAITAAATSVTVDSAAGITAGASVIYVGNEAMRVTGVAGAVLTVERAWLDTEAMRHADDAPVALFLPYMGSRRARLYVVPIDAADASQETLFGDYFLDTFELTEDLNGFILRGKSNLHWLGINVARRRRHRYRIDTLYGLVLGWSHHEESTADGYAVPAWPSARIFAKVKDEIILLSPLSGRQVYTVTDRGLLGTLVDSIDLGDEAEVVFAADPSTFTGTVAPSFFRNSPGPSPSSSRSSGTWNPSAHWIDIILNLAVSSANSTDGLELANRNATYGAWDCLPVGIGIGVPHAQIDWQSAMDVRSRTPEFLFHDFFVGPETVPFAELISHHFLKPIGAYLSTVSGTMRIILPRAPLAGASSVAIGSSDLMARPVSAGLYRSAIKAKKRLTDVATSIKFSGKNDRHLLVNNADFGPVYGDGSYYRHEDRTVEIDVPSARFDENGFNEFLYRAAMRRLLRRRRPPWISELPSDISRNAIDIGSLVAVTHEDMPDLGTGTRGWTSVISEVHERVVRIQPDDGARIAFVAQSFGSTFRAGRIPPAARIVSVAASGPNFLITISANRYTETDAQDGLPILDSSSFVVNDVVQIRRRTGTLVVSTSQIVTAINPSELRVDGDFGGNLTVGAGNLGQLIVYARSAAAVAQQTNSFVYWADKPDLTVGATAQTPWKYGEQ